MTNYKAMNRLIEFFPVIVSFLVALLLTLYLQPQYHKSSVVSNSAQMHEYDQAHI
jgi:hypothetical protein